MAIGVEVVTMPGALQPIRWIGRRSNSSEVAAGNYDVPVLIRAGALADDAPRRDLWVSPHHAMYLDGMLIPAAALINGVSISDARGIAEAADPG